MPGIEADAGQIRLVLVSLITNAVEAIGDDPGTIAVRARAGRFTRADFEDAARVWQTPDGDYVLSRDHRLGVRHGRGDAAADARAVLHHQGGGTGTRPGRRPRDRAGPSGRPRRDLGDRPRHDRPRLPPGAIVVAAGPSGRDEGSGADIAARQASPTIRSSWWTTSRWCARWPRPACRARGSASSPPATGGRRAT